MTCVWCSKREYFVNEHVTCLWCVTCIGDEPCCLLVLSGVEAEQQTSHSSVPPCVITNDITSAAAETEAEARRDSGISVASSLVTTSLSDPPPPATSLHTAMVEEPTYCDLDVDCHQSVTDAGSRAPVVLPWISLPADQGGLSAVL